MNFSQSQVYILLILCFGLLGGCSTQPDYTERTRESLSEIAVNSFNHFKGKLYASTDEGLYRKEKNDTSWVSLGLTPKEVLEVVFLPGGDILAAVRISDYSENIPSLFLTTDDGRSWQPNMNNYGGNTDVTWVGSMTTTSKPSDTLFASPGIVPAKSTNGGRKWGIYGGQWDVWGGEHPLFEIDSYHSCHIWRGGADVFFKPYLSKSEDCGKTWQAMTALENTEATVYDVAVKPSNENVILVGFGGGVAPANVIRKSTDGGVSWQTVYQGVNTRTFTHSARNPATVYASGIRSSGSLFFLTGNNFGENWKMTTIDSEYSQIIINDMLSTIEEGREVLYLGTNKGLITHKIAK